MLSMVKQQRSLLDFMGAGDPPSQLTCRSMKEDTIVTFILYPECANMLIWIINFVHHVLYFLYFVPWYWQMSSYATVIIELSTCNNTVSRTGFSSSVILLNLHKQASQHIDCSWWSTSANVTYPIGSSFLCLEKLLCLGGWSTRGIR